MNQSKPFRIAFIPTSNSGVVYWRIFNFVQAMRKLPNTEIALFCWQSQMERAHPWQEDCYSNKRVRVEIEDLVKCADVTIFQTVCTPMALSMIEALKETYKKPILMEIDDYIFNIPKYNEGSQAYFPNSDLEYFAFSQMKISDGLIVTTPYLKKVYTEQNPNIYIVPNSIDFDLWKEYTPKHSDMRIGWIGGGTHAEDIEMVFPAIEQVIDKYQKRGMDIKFYCIHGVPNFLKSEKYFSKVFWTHEWVYILKYPQFLASFEFDIGIAPLLENSFNLAKSNLRWLEYSAYKIPSICSNLGHFADTIEHGKTGFLADTEGEWINYLSQLVESADLRKRIGQAGYDEVFDKFNVMTTAEKYLEILKKVVKEHDTSRVGNSNR